MSAKAIERKLAFLQFDLEDLQAKIDGWRGTLDRLQSETLHDGDRYDLAVLKFNQPDLFE